MDSFGSPLPSNSVHHSPWQVLWLTSSVCSDEYVFAGWLTLVYLFVEEFADEFIVVSPIMPSKSCLSYLDGLCDGLQVVM